MRYVKDDVIYTISQVRKLFPEKSIPYGANCSKLGFDTLEETTPPTVADGYRAVEISPIDGVQQWGVVLKDEKVIVGEYTMFISQHIHARLIAYNEANAVDFGSIHNMAIYTLDPTYIHYQFALDVIAWNKAVWEKFREVMLSVKVGDIDLPTKAELEAVLPVYSGVE